MRISRTMVATLAAATTLAALAGGCSKTAQTTGKPNATSSSAATSSPAAAPGASGKPGDYTKLLIQSSDIDAPVTFTANPPAANPDGKPGVTTTFNTEDGDHQVIDTIQVLADPAAATDALNSAKATRGKDFKEPKTDSIDVGTGGTTISGTTTDGKKGVTVVLFTQGNAFVSLDFVGPPDFLAPPDFVSKTSKKQAETVQKGLGG